jgi:hypothetical protein
VRYIVAFEEVGKDSAAAERIRFKSHENDHWWRERMVGSLKMEV